jgi:hypothetical protein
VPDLLAELLRRPRWHARAACRDTPSASFFADGKASKALARAKSICAGCEVRCECETAGFAGDETGVWGGLSERDRHRARQGRPELAPDPVLVAVRRRATVCGTEDGWAAHRRHGEPVCDGCLVAHRVNGAVAAETVERAREDDAFWLLVGRTFATYTDTAADDTLDVLAGGKAITVDATVEALAGQLDELTGPAHALLGALLESWRAAA